VLEQAGQGRKAAAHGCRCRSFLFAPQSFPRDDGTVIDLTQRVRGRDAKGAHEVVHVEPVGAVGLRALLLRQPDLFFGDGRERIERGEFAGAPDRNRSGGTHDACVYPEGQHPVRLLFSAVAQCKP
jgi:hypothetical protein